MDYYTPIPGPAPRPTPFSSLSITHASDLHTVNACFHSGAAPADARMISPMAVCYRYAGRTPIFAITQGALHAQLSSVDAGHVTWQDLDTAHALTRAAAE